MSEEMCKSWEALSYQFLKLKEDGISVERLMSFVDIINSIVSKDTDHFCSWLSNGDAWYSNKRIIFNQNDISYVIKKINQELWAHVMRTSREIWQSKGMFAGIAFYTSFHPVDFITNIAWFTRGIWCYPTFPR